MLATSSSRGTNNQSAMQDLAHHTVTSAPQHTLAFTGFQNTQHTLSQLNFGHHSPKRPPDQASLLQRVLQERGIRQSIRGLWV